MIKFFRICGIVSFLGIFSGLSHLFSSASVNDLAGTLMGISLAFFSFACGMLFLSVAKLIKRIEKIEGKNIDKF